MGLKVVLLFFVLSELMRLRQLSCCVLHRPWIHDLRIAKSKGKERGPRVSLGETLQVGLSQTDYSGYGY